MGSRTQFTFYESFYKATQRIKDPLARAQVYEAICEYALYGVVPDMNSLSDVAAIAFELVKPNLDASRKKAEAGRAGGSRKQNESKSKQTEATTKQGQTRSKKENEIENKKEKENENEIEIEKKSYNGRDRPPARFVPPTVEEVKAYCQERKNAVDPQCFVDYYTANGWVQGKGNPIKDWRATVRTWERRGAAPKSVTPGQDFQPSPDRLQRNAEWLDKFLKEQEGTA